MLRGVNTHLTGHRRQHQDKGVDGGGTDGQVTGFGLPEGLLPSRCQVARRLANHEVGREESGEEHELARQPHPDTHG